MGSERNGAIVDKYLVVIDLEATFWGTQAEAAAYKPEIIEFAAVLLNLNTGSINDQIHQYVKPSQNSQLSRICMEKTGVTQYQVNNGIPLKEALDQFQKWLEKMGMYNNFTCTIRSGHVDCAPATWSDQDFRVMLKRECDDKNIKIPPFFCNYVNLQKIHQDFFNLQQTAKLEDGLAKVGLRFEGRPHSGIDDAKNAARLAAKLKGHGCIIKITSTV